MSTQSFPERRSSLEPAHARVVPVSVHKELLDPAIWREGLENYAYATNLAVALIDSDGQVIGECWNPRPLWSLLRQKNPVLGECPFCLLPSKPCIRTDLMAEMTWATDFMGLVHFTVPLTFQGSWLGSLMAGQVFDQHPEQLRLEEMARKRKVSAEAVIQHARLMVPVSRRTLTVYSRLLSTLGYTLLQTRYYSLIEAGKQDLLRLELSERKQAETQIQKLNEALGQKVADFEQVVRELKRSKVELQEKIEELEKFADATVGRELKMIELERELARLRSKGQPPHSQ